MSIICAFFGHRTIPDDLEPRLRETIRQAIEDYGITEFWNGGYGGFDRLAEHVVASLKPEYPHIKNRLVCAYKPQYAPRPTFDSCFYPDHLDNYPDRWHIPCRNKWMAEQCDLMITYVEHADSKIYEPLDHITGKKPILNLGAYQPKNPK
ncbi:MAG: hypothetical protein IKU34_07295 [Clostridia bacterium]|nr:hypothetical protein [Clostridia bacterium]